MTHHTAHHCHHSTIRHWVKPRILLRLLLLITTFLWLTILRTYSSSSLLSGVTVVDLVDDGPSFTSSSTTFTPDEFQSGNIDRYINLPLTPPNPRRDVEIDQLTAAHVPRPAERLLHVAPTPPGNNVVLGLASYPTFMVGWTRLVGSLRNSGYDGHIIMGVNPDIPQMERDYLDKMGVTYYAIDVVNCTTTTVSSAASSTTTATDGETTKNTVRAKCSRGLRDLKLEWGRYEMARRWLYHCSTCTGWAMVLDTRDVFFQSNPFSTLPIILGSSNSNTTTKHDLLFVEEIASYTNTIPEQSHRATNIGQSHRYIYHTEPCYGKESVRANKLLDRPMLCSGTVLGTRAGMHRFLSVLVNEFYANNKKPNQKCHSPGTTDQWTMNHLYYNGRFGYMHTTKTLPWGTGPVLTIGTPCVNSALLGTKTKTSQKDMIQFHPLSGLILNPHEKEDSDTRIAPTLHQYDRCHDWIVPWFQEHESLFL